MSWVPTYNTNSTKPQLNITDFLLSCLPTFSLLPYMNIENMLPPMTYDCKLA